MSLATLIPQAQAATASAGIIKNILAGLVPSVSGLDAVAVLAKDLGGFQFDYIGDEDLDATVEITKHYTEKNDFFQDHRAVGPTILTFRGFVAETRFNKNSLVSSVLGLSAALATLQPYVGTYAPGTTAKMINAVDQADQVIEQLAQISGVAGSVLKLVGAFSTTRVQDAYNKLDALRLSGTPFAVVTPWAVFGDFPDNGHGPMMIESLRFRSPEETKSWADIVVRLVEIRFAPSLLPTTIDNARGSQLPTQNGAVGAH